jgi:hypothetical protein
VYQYIVPQLQKVFIMMLDISIQRRHALWYLISACCFLLIVIPKLVFAGGSIVASLEYLLMVVLVVSSLMMLVQWNIYCHRSRMGNANVRSPLLQIYMGITAMSLVVGTGYGYAVDRFFFCGGVDIVVIGRLSLDEYTVMSIICSVITVGFVCSRSHMLPHYLTRAFEGYLTMDRFVMTSVEIVRRSCVQSLKMTWLVCCIVMLGFVAFKSVSFIAFDLLLCHIYQSCGGPQSMMIAYLECSMFLTPMVLLLKSQPTLWSLVTMGLRSLVVSFALSSTLSSLTDSLSCILLAPLDFRLVQLSSSTTATDGNRSSMRAEDLLIDGLLEGIVVPAQKATSIESIKQHQLVTHQQRHSYLVSSIVPSFTSRGAPSFVPYLEQETYYNAFVWMVDWLRDFILCSAISGQTSAAVLTSSSSSSSSSSSTRGIIDQRSSHRVLVGSTSLLRRTLAFQDLAHLSLCSVLDDRGTAGIPQERSGLLFDALAARRRELFSFHWDAVVIGTCTMMDAMAIQVKQFYLLFGPSLPAAFAHQHPNSCSIYSLAIYRSSC